MAIEAHVAKMTRLELRNGADEKGRRGSANMTDSRGLVGTTPSVSGRSGRKWCTDSGGMRSDQKLGGETNTYLVDR